MGWDDEFCFNGDDILASSDAGINTIVGTPFSLLPLTGSRVGPTSGMGTLRLSTSNGRRTGGSEWLASANRSEGEGEGPGRELCITFEGGFERGFGGGT